MGLIGARVPMKRFVVGAGGVIALFIACMQINGAQSSDSPPNSTSSVAATIPSGQAFILQLDTPMNTRTTKKGDKIEFHTAADIIIDDQILIPNQSLVRAEVKKSKRAGAVFGRSELQLHFIDVKLPDGTVIPIQASITRSGFDPVDPAAKEDPKLKGDAARGADVRALASAGAQGAIVGALSGGLRGVLFGAGAGAASTAIGSMLRRGPDIDLPHNTMFEARLDKPLEIPAQSVLEQNNPATIHSRAAALNASLDEPAANGRPLLRRPKIAHPIEEPSISEAEPAGEPTDAGMPEEEPIAKARPTLRRPESAQPIEEASISKPEPDLPSAVPHAEAAPVEPAVAGVKISVRVKMVQVDAVVRDHSGHLMSNLRTEDFRVYEDNVLQEVAGFSQDELPLAVAIVVDHSGSVSPYISELRRIATQTLDNLKPNDEVCLFTFAANVQRLEDLTSSRERIANAIDRIHAFGGTDITGALYEAVRYLANAAPDRRHAIVLISDNEQTVPSSVSDHDLITTAQEKDVVVYSLKTSGSPLALGARLPSLIFGDAINRVAQDTGGELIKVANVSSLDSALGSVISRLRTSYSIGYYPASSSKTGVFHEITVRLADTFGKPGKDYSIRAKRGYYAVQSSKSVADSQPLE
jgi:Ca-activated chloride channel homolog